MEQQRVTGWAGWGLFAAILLMVGAAIEILFGLLAIILPASAYFTTREGTTVFFVSLWGWWHLLIGLVLLSAGIALAGGRPWARVFAVVVVAVNAVGQLLSLPAQPWWSAIVFSVDVVILYAITVHGRELGAFAARRSRG